MSIVIAWEKKMCRDVNQKWKKISNQGKIHAVNHTTADNSLRELIITFFMQDDNSDAT